MALVAAGEELYRPGAHDLQVRLIERAGDSGGVLGGLDLVSVGYPSRRERSVVMTGEELEGLAMAWLRHGSQQAKCPSCAAPVARCFFCREPATRFVTSAESADGPVAARDLHLCDKHAAPFLLACGEWGEATDPMTLEPIDPDGWAPEVAYYEPNHACAICSGGN